MTAATTFDVRRLMTDMGLDTLVADHGVIVDAGKSMSDEFGWVVDRRGLRNWLRGDKWIDTGETSSEVQQVLDVVLAIAGVTDPNHIVQAALVSNEVFAAEPIHTETVSDWLLRNRPAPDEMRGTSFGPGLQSFAGVIANELGLPEIEALATYTTEKQVPQGPIAGTRPYVLNILSDGDPKDYYVALYLLRAFSYAPIIVNLLYVSNQRAGKEVLESYQQANGHFAPNVRFIDLGDLQSGLSHEEIARRYLNGLSETVAALRAAGLLTTN